MPRRPCPGTDLETGPARPGQRVDHVFGAEVVADQIHCAAEQQDRDFLEQLGEELDRRRACLGSECKPDGPITFHPTRLRWLRDVERGKNVRTPQVRLYVFQIRRPVHAAGGIGVSEADIVHVRADIYTVLPVFCALDDGAQDLFAGWYVNFGEVGADG